MSIDRIILTVAILIGLYLFIQPIWYRLQRIHRTSKGFQIDQWPRRIGRFISEVLFQSKIIESRKYIPSVTQTLKSGILAEVLVPELINCILIVFITFSIVISFSTRNILKFN